MHSKCNKLFFQLVFRKLDISQVQESLKEVKAFKELHGTVSNSKKYNYARLQEKIYNGICRKLQ